MSRSKLYLLGPPRLEVDGEQVHIGRRKALALLAYLAVEQGNHSRDALATLFWPDYDQSGARGRLRRTLSDLNRTLGQGRLTVTREHVGLNPDVRMWLDVAEFRQRLVACELLGHVPIDPCPDCVARLTEAAELYRDDFMSGLTLPDSLEFDEWQRYHAEGLRDELADVLERLVSCHSAAQDYEPAIVYARRWLTLDPLEEHAHQALMELYMRAGRRSAALRQYRACVRALEEQLGVPPAAETTALYERVREQTVVREEEPETSGPTPAHPRPRPPAFLDSEQEHFTGKRVRFLAREQELAQLESYLDVMLAGEGHVVFVTGGAGRGKTTLLGEFGRRATAKHPDLLAATGSCNAYSGAGDPYLPFRQLTGMLTGNVETDWSTGAISREQAQRLWAALPLMVQTLLAHDPHLIDVFLPGPGLLTRATAFSAQDDGWLERLQEWVQREKGERGELEQRYLFEQYTDVLRAVASQHPLVLMLDDLQWADTPSISLCFHLGRRLADAGGRVLIVGAYRAEEIALGREGDRHPLEEVLSEFKRRFGNAWLDLASADEMAGRRFVDACLDSAPNRLDETFRKTMTQRTGGHPLFTVELFRAMQEREDVVRDETGQWVAGPALDWETLPSRVEAVIEARLGRLDEELRDILTIASVEGERFTAQVIAQVQGSPERNALRALSQALGSQGHRLVREGEETQVGASGRYASRYQFAHALFQEYLYRGLGAGERRLLHREVGESLEALYGNQTTQIAAQLMRHYDQAGQRGKTIHYTLLVAEQARLVYIHDEAIANYQKALALLGTDLVLPDARREKRWRMEALRGLGLVHFARGEGTTAEECLREAIELGQELAVASRELVRLYFWLGEVLWWQGRYDERLRIGEQGLALLEAEAASTEAVDAGESVEVALMNQLIAAVYWEGGNPEKFYEFVGHTERFVQRLPYSEELRPVFEQVVLAHTENKDAGQVTEYLRIFEARAKQFHDLTAVGAVHALAGYDLMKRGALRGSASRYLQAIKIFTQVTDARDEAGGRLSVAYVYLQLGELQKAAVSAHIGLEIAERVGIDGIKLFAQWTVGRIFLCQGEWENALAAFEKAWVLVESIAKTLKSDNSRINYVLGRTYLGQGDRVEALRRLKDGIVWQRRSMFPGALQPPNGLAGLEEAYRDADAFRAFCHRFREEHEQVDGLPHMQWFLEPAEPTDIRQSLVQVEFDDRPLSPEWMWQDRFGDCTYTIECGLEIRAANGRDLRSVNVSAPRLLRNAPENGQWAAQTICGTAAADRPAIGGLLMWRDEENYLRLDRGTVGEDEIVFHGCLDNQDLIIGRGRLSMDTAERVFLRLERMAARVNALCSADGAEWFKVGHIEFPVVDPVQIGLHAIGNIDRTTYHGAYPEGTAIRFESFTVWGLDY